MFSTALYIKKKQSITNSILFNSLCFILIYTFVMSVVLFLSFPVETHEIDTDNNERNAQPLSHIQSHTVFKVYLVLFQELDEEAEYEYFRQAKAEVETTMIGEGDLFFQSPFIQVNHSQEEDKISDCFVKLRRMAGKHIYPFKDESPRHIGGLADDFRIHQVARRMQHAVIGVATAIISSTSM